jgi:hypothetical protein
MNLLLETILFLFTIFISNGLIYSLTFFNLNEKNSSSNISYQRNNSEKDVLGLTSLISSSSLSLTSSESSSSDSLSVSSSDTKVSDSLSVSSSDTKVSDDIMDDILEAEALRHYETVGQYMPRAENSLLSGINDGTVNSNSHVFDNTTSLDSITILNGPSVEQWMEIARDLHELPINTPAGILQQVKFEELNILYSQDIILYGITQAELRLIIELIPSWDLFKPGVNHLILMIMSYYHL